MPIGGVFLLTLLVWPVALILALTLPKKRTPRSSPPDA